MADELALLARLEEGHRSKLHAYGVREAYYRGAIRLASMGLALPPEWNRLQVVVNWPRLAVDELELRLDVDGFRIGSGKNTNASKIETLWGWWNANDMRVEAGMIHTEALAHTHSFATVGINEATAQATPLYRGESPNDMSVETDPRTGEVLHAVRFYGKVNLSNPEPSSPGSYTMATLYLPDSTVQFVWGNGGWLQTDRDDHNRGVVPVVCYVNRPRLNDRFGVSEIDDVAQLTDAACRALTNLQGAQEALALPSRFIVGAKPDDFKDQNGNPVTKWEAYLNRYNLLPKDATVSQLQGADLTNFKAVVSLYADLVCGVTGIANSSLGMAQANPVSAEALNAGDNRLIKRTERKAVTFGPGHVRLQQLGSFWMTGTKDSDLDALEAVWADPATPTFSQKAAGVVALYANGNGLLPREAAWQKLGYSPEEIADLKRMDQEDQTNSFINDLAPQANTAVAGVSGAGATTVTPVAEDEPTP